MKIFARTPWYIGGLAFECLQCGHCCEGPEEGYVWVSREEIARIAAHLGISVDRMHEQYVRRVGRRYSLIERPDNRDCIFLVPMGDGRLGCAVYPVRPTQCRTWPFWTSNLLSPESWADAGVRCPGINRGDRFDFNEIEERRLGTRE